MARGFIHKEDQHLSTGSIIHWGERDGSKRWDTIPVTCGVCHTKRSIKVPTERIADGRFTGFCPGCGYIGGRLGICKISKEKRGPHLYPLVRINREGYHNVLISRLSSEDKELARAMKAKGAYVLEHRLIMAQHLGRPLMRHEIVHHRDGDKTNNKLENLELLNADAHVNGHMGQLYAEIARLQGILDDHGISY